MNSGLLRKQVVPFLGADGLYSITRGGIQALEEMGITYLGGYVERERDPQEVQIPHVLELNRIRFALERSGALLSRVPETFIRVLNLSPVFCYAKAYDAVAKVILGDGMSAEFAIEYERTLKSEQKYEKILEALASERRLHTILYLTPSYEIAATLRRYFQRARHQILCALADDFKRGRSSIRRWILRAHITGCSRYERRCFRTPHDPKALALGQAFRENIPRALFSLTFRCVAISISRRAQRPRESMGCKPT